MHCPKCGKPIPQGKTECPDCGTLVVLTEQGEQKFTNDPQKSNLCEKPTMKWYKFIIYFQLFAGMVLYLVNAFYCFGGFQYGENSAAVYNRIPSLKMVDIIYGLILLGFAFFALVVRSDLAKYRRSAPKEYTALYIAECAVSVIYMFLAQGLVVGATGNASAITEVLPDIFRNILGTVVYVVIMNIYFKKRYRLFNN